MQGARAEGRNLSTWYIGKGTQPQNGHGSQQMTRLQQTPTCFFTQYHHHHNQETMTSPSQISFPSLPSMKTNTNWASDWRAPLSENNTNRLPNMQPCSSKPCGSSN